MNSIIIKKITFENELPACAELLVDAYNAEPWNDAWTAEVALEKLNCFFNSPKFHGWMAFEGEQLLGCCIGNIEPYFAGDYFYLKEMFVAHKQQKRGVGKALMAHLKAFLPGIGINSMILFTGKDFFPFDFYLKSGFNEMEEMRMMHFQRSS